MQHAGEKDIALTLAKPQDELKAWMLYVAIGSSDVAEDEVNDTGLVSELHRKVGEVRVVRNTYFVKATFGQDEPTADGLSISEIGIFDASVDGTLGRRWVLPTVVSKDNVDEIVVECAVTMLHGTLSALDGISLSDVMTASDVLLVVSSETFSQAVADTFTTSELLAILVSGSLVDTFTTSELLAILVSGSLVDTFVVGGKPVPTYGLGSMVLGVDILGEVKLQD